MRILQQNIAVLADNAAELVIQLRELEQLREQLRELNNLPGDRGR